MDGYIYLSIKTWKSIYLLLKFRGLTLAKISKEIGCDFRNALYKGHGMPADSFNRLAELAGISSDFVSADQHLSLDFNLGKATIEA